MAEKSKIKKRKPKKSKKQRKVKKEVKQSQKVSQIVKVIIGDTKKSKRRTKTGSSVVKQRTTYPVVQYMPPVPFQPIQPPPLPRLDPVAQQHRSELPFFNPPTPAKIPAFYNDDAVSVLTDPFEELGEYRGGTLEGLSLVSELRTDDSRLGFYEAGDSRDDGERTFTEPFSVGVQTEPFTEFSPERTAISLGSIITEPFKPPRKTRSDAGIPRGPYRPRRTGIPEESFTYQRDDREVQRQRDEESTNEEQRLRRAARVASIGLGEGSEEA
tara:strand:+ start:1503 stop:2312 length:810 start_codon:yes stop_codon:yes gene_type:complete